MVNFKIGIDKLFLVCKRLWFPFVLNFLMLILKFAQDICFSHTALKNEYRIEILQISKRLFKVRTKLNKYVSMLGMRRYL